MTNLMDFIKKDRTYFDNLILLIALYLIVSASGVFSFLYSTILILINGRLTDLFHFDNINFRFVT